jgi:hypothetical protein
MTGIRRVSQLGTTGESTYVDGSIQAVDIASNVITQDKLSTDIPLSGMRNVLINGGMTVWQRWVATSIDVSNGVTGYTADRWYLKPTGANMSAIRDTSVPTGSISQYSLAITPNGVGGSTCLLGQRIEAANVYALKGTVTFSAWVFNSTGASITPSLLIGTPSAADNFTTVTNRLTQTLQACDASVWTKVYYSVDISGYTNINNGLQVELQTNGHTTYGKIVKVTEIQLEKNAQPTPFEQRPIGIELALCQRYYWRSTSGLTTDGNSRHAHFRRLNAYQMIATGHCSFPVPMRAEPSVSLYNGNGIGFVDAYGAGQESYVIASAEGLSTFGLGMIVKYTNSGLGTTANFAGDPASYSYWMNIEASAEL